ncbi:hypothetical protein [Rickettsia asembonensis]|uniref:hypothetical protein n=1 Tax=Rickettsia asembonensis TaxID=1068590 RepID=UPI0011BADAB0|nr:hypothetical protein [Rickettsia asembonensis]
MSFPLGICYVVQFICHCEKNYVVIRRSNPVKNSVYQNFFNYFSELLRRFAPRNDDSGVHATRSDKPRHDISRQITI